MPIVYKSLTGRLYHKIAFNTLKIKLQNEERQSRRYISPISSGTLEAKENTLFQSFQFSINNVVSQFVAGKKWHFSTFSKHLHLVECIG